MRQVHGVPLLAGTDGSTRLEQVGLSEGVGNFSEAWLQRLIFEHPEALPVDEIEPAFDELVPVCMELPTPHGPMDNLFMTPEGDLVFVEVKLWRNPEARRKVVAQALDYASCLFEMRYAELEQAVLKANFGKVARPASLYSIFRDRNPKDEAAFIDAVNTNLRRGRALILVVGDGIRSEAARLAALVQSHAGSHFTFALVELGVFRMPQDDSLLILPRTLAQTEMISRAIVQIDDRRTSFILPDTGSKPDAAKPLPESISADQFYESMSHLDPAIPNRLRALLKALEPLGVYPDFRRSLILRWDPPTGRSINLGYIMRNGHIYTDATSANLPNDLVKSYVGDLASALALNVAQGSNGRTWNLREGSAVPHIENVSQKLDSWPPVIDRFLERLKSEFHDK